MMKLTAIPTHVHIDRHTYTGSVRMAAEAGGGVGKLLQPRMGLDLCWWKLEGRLGLGGAHASLSLLLLPG